jgi:hypothetical protein
MGVTRTSSPIQGVLFAWFRTNNEWQQAEVLRAITEGGCPKKLVRLPDGTEREVCNDLLRFGKRKPRR